MVGAVPVGGGAPVSVQSMTTTLTADVNATLQQIAELTATGCQIVRVAVPSQDDVDAYKAEPKFYEAIAADQQVALPEMMYVGDRPAGVRVEDPVDLLAGHRPAVPLGPDHVDG